MSQDNITTKASIWKENQGKICHNMIQISILISIWSPILIQFLCITPSIYPNPVTAPAPNHASDIDTDSSNYNAIYIAISTDTNNDYDTDNDSDTDNVTYTDTYTDTYLPLHQPFRWWSPILKHNQQQ